MATDEHIYFGNCHCGAFRFMLRLQQELNTVYACDCDLCKKKGYYWVFPLRDEVEIVRGDDAGISKYRIRGGEEKHSFCRICGTGVMVEGHKTPHGGKGFAVNARALLGVNPFTLKVERLGSSENNEALANLDTTGPELQRLYGGCHCGAVKIELQTQPLTQVEIKEDNCSICQRNANICIYPSKSQVSIIGTENVTEYLFSRKFNGHCFCNICGVNLYMELHGPPKEVVERLPLERQEMVRKMLDVVPLRAAVFDGIDMGKLSVKRSDEGTEGYIV